jgi:hypothetical protein
MKSLLVAALLLIPITAISEDKPPPPKEGL